MAIRGNRDYITQKEFRKLLKAISSSRDKLILTLLYYTGISARELVGLKVKDIHLDLGTLIIGNRKIKLIPGVQKRLAGYIQRKSLKKSQFLFSTRQSPQITVRRIQQLLIHYEKKACLKKKINPRLLRQSFIIQAFFNKLPFEAILESAGVQNLHPWFRTLFVILQENYRE